MGRCADAGDGADRGGPTGCGRLLQQPHFRQSLRHSSAPFMQALGAQAPVFYDTIGAYGGRGTLSRVVAQILGTEPAQPFFDLANSDVVFSFGADLTGTWLSPVAYGRAYGQMRGRALGKRGYVVQLEPRMSATGAIADEWIPIRPGTEGQVALALGKIMVEQGIGAAASSPYAALYEDVDAAGIAEYSGVGLERLEKLAARVRRSRAALGDPRRRGYRLHQRRRGNDCRDAAQRFGGQPEPGAERTVANAAPAGSGLCRDARGQVQRRASVD